ncbi:MAG: hypothetical protein RMK99_09220 [Anaerolineales bacterium]|nr:hypothetical protein [Anaerolineales bacterium]
MARRGDAAAPRALEARQESGAAIIVRQNDGSDALCEKVKQMIARIGTIIFFLALLAVMVASVLDFYVRVVTLIDPVGMYDAETGAYLKSIGPATRAVDADFAALGRDPLLIQDASWRQTVQARVDEALTRLDQFPHIKKIPPSCWREHVALREAVDAHVAWLTEVRAGLRAGDLDAINASIVLRWDAKNAWTRYNQIVCSRLDCSQP